METPMEQSGQTSSHKEMEAPMGQNGQTSSHKEMETPMGQDGQTSSHKEMESPIEQKSVDAENAVEGKTHIVKKKLSRRTRWMMKYVPNGREYNPGKLGDLMNSFSVNGQGRTDQPKLEISAANGGRIPGSSNGQGQTSQPKLEISAADGGKIPDSPKGQGQTGQLKLEISAGDGGGMSDSPNGQGQINQAKLEISASDGNRIPNSPNVQGQTGQPKLELSAADGNRTPDSPKKKAKRNRKKRKKKNRDNESGSDNKDTIGSPAKRMRIDDTTGEGKGQNSVTPVVLENDGNGTPIVAKKKRKRTRKKKTTNVSLEEGEIDEENKLKRLKVSNVDSNDKTVPVETETPTEKKKKKNRPRKKKKPSAKAEMPVDGTTSTSEKQDLNVGCSDKTVPVETGTPVEKKTISRRKEYKQGITQNSGEPNLDKSENQGIVSVGKESTVSPKKKRRKRNTKKRRNSGRSISANEVEMGKNSVIKKQIMDAILKNIKGKLSDGDIDDILNSVKKKLSDMHGESAKESLNTEPSSPEKQDSTEKIIKVEPIESNQTTDIGQTSNEGVVSVSAQLNELYSDHPRKEEITRCWTETSLLQKENGFELLDQPFRCCYMPEFLQNANILQKVKEELGGIDLIKKSNDLYQFHQTSDLKAVLSPYIASLREFLYGDFRKWLSDVTGIELSSTVDMGSSQYGYTDVLLCHDDELEGRRVAYILYLTPPWYEEDGGMLDLYDVDQKGQPKDVVKSLQPKWNTFAFFEVSPVSFHQVREVLAKEKVRLSINGWFHGPNIERPPKHVEPPRPLTSPVDFDEEELYAWINPSYLDAETQRSIRKKFQNDSEIELESFLCDEKYEELSKAMQSKVLEWQSTRPANKQSYKVLKQEKLPDIIETCSNFLKSEALFLILSQLTGLKLHHLAPPDSDPDSSDEEEGSKNSSPGMTLDIRQWSHGCYTLLRDSDQGDKSSALDANLFINVADAWTLDHGGFTSYIAKDEDEELLTVLPRSNCLALVYRDSETLKFTKYVNARVKDLGIEKSVFYDFCCTYKDMAGDEIDLDLLLSLVEEKPVFWEEILSDCKSQDFTSSIWREVCSRFKHNFEFLSDKAKNKYGKHIVKKWINFQNSQLKVQKKAQELKASVAVGKIFNRNKCVYKQQLASSKESLVLKETVFSFMAENTENIENNITSSNNNCNSEGIDSPQSPSEGIDLPQSPEGTDLPQPPPEGISQSQPPEGINQSQPPEGISLAEPPSEGICTPQPHFEEISLSPHSEGISPLQPPSERICSPQPEEIKLSPPCEGIHSPQSPERINSPQPHSEGISQQLGEGINSQSSSEGFSPLNSPEGIISPYSPCILISPSQSLSEGINSPCILISPSQSLYEGVNSPQHTEGISPLQLLPDGINSPQPPSERNSQQLHQGVNSQPLEGISLLQSPPEGMIPPKLPPEGISPLNPPEGIIQSQHPLKGINPLQQPPEGISQPPLPERIGSQPPFEGNSPSQPPSKRSCLPKPPPEKISHQPHPLERICPPQLPPNEVNLQPPSEGIGPPQHSSKRIIPPQLPSKILCPQQLLFEGTTPSRYSPQGNNPPLLPPEQINPSQPIELSDETKVDGIKEKMLDNFEAPEKRHLCFFKGILPSLEKLNEEQIIQFQSGIMKTLRSVRGQQSSAPNSGKASRKKHAKLAKFKKKRAELAKQKKKCKDSTSIPTTSQRCIPICSRQQGVRSQIHKQATVPHRKFALQPPENLAGQKGIQSQVP